MLNIVPPPRLNWTHCGITECFVLVSLIKRSVLALKVVDIKYYTHLRRLMGSTDQADPS